jgi:hypothetical protein
MSKDYYSVLAQAIAGVSADQAEARWKVYEAARNALRRELHRQYTVPRTGNINGHGLAEQMAALNRAIQQIESEFAYHMPLLSSYSTGQRDKLDKIDDAAKDASTTAQTLTRAILPDEPSEEVSTRIIEGEILPPVTQGSRTKFQNDPRPALPEFQEMHRSPSGSIRKQPPPPSRASLWPAVSVTAAVALGAALYLAIASPDQLSRVTTRDAPNSNVESNPLQVSTSAPKTPSPTAGVPLPTAYGAYAVEDGKLTGLQILPIRVPDPRVEVSAMISTPSASTFNSGQLVFVIFRRDFVDDAPARATVRVIARVRDKLEPYTNGNRKRVAVEGSWAIRSNAYDMNVAPVESNPAMIVIRPKTPDFSFPPGRYALVLKNIGYDFAVAGAITGSAQCLERSGAAEMAIYLECRKM